MAVMVNTVVLEDGPRNCVVHMYGEVTGGDYEFNVKKIDVTTLSRLPNTSQSCTKLALEKIQYSTQNLSVHLSSEGVPTNSRLFLIPANFSDTQDFRRTSPIQNAAVGYTGNVLLSTVNDGDPQLDGRYDIVAWFRKKYETTTTPLAFSVGSQPLRFPTLLNINEAADQVYGFNYTSATVASYGGYGTTTTKLPASADGYFGGTVGSFNVTPQGPIIGMKASATNVAYTSLDYGIYGDNPGSRYNVITSGTGGLAPDLVVIKAIGDVMRMRRVGTTLYGEVSKNGGSTYAIVKTWTGVTTNALYGSIGMDTGISLKQVFSSTNWA